MKPPGKYVKLFQVIILKMGADNSVFRTLEKVIESVIKMLLGGVINMLNGKDFKSVLIR